MVSCAFISPILHTHLLHFGRAWQKSLVGYATSIYFSDGSTTLPGWERVFVFVKNSLDHHSAFSRPSQTEDHFKFSPQ
jgi:hypothetical protein